MFQKSACLVFLLVLTASAAGSKLIPEKCLIRGDYFGYFGDSSLENIDAFRQDSDILANLSVDFRPVEYAFCIDIQNSNRLVSFTI